MISKREKKIDIHSSRKREKDPLQNFNRTNQQKEKRRAWGDSIDKSLN